MSHKYQELIKNEEILYYHHKDGITIDNFKNNSVLNLFFDVLATVHNQTTVAAV